MQLQLVPVVEGGGGGSDTEDSDSDSSSLKSTAIVGGVKPVPASDLELGAPPDKRSRIDPSTHMAPGALKDPLDRSPGYGSK